MKVRKAATKNGLIILRRKDSIKLGRNRIFDVIEKIM